MIAEDDEPLMARLREIAAEVDGPPELLTTMARAALSTRRLDGELAELVLDSERDTLALVRDDSGGGSGGIRLLSLETSTVSVELQIEEADGLLTVRGLVAGAHGPVTVETTTTEHGTGIDEYGLFVVSGLRPGLVRVRLRADDGTAVITSWVTV